MRATSFLTMLRPPSKLKLVQALQDLLRCGWLSNQRTIWPLNLATCRTFFASAPGVLLAIISTHARIDFDEGGQFPGRIANDSNQHRLVQAPYPAYQRR